MTASLANAAFDSLAKRILDERWEAYPHEAVAVGLHEYDGRMPVLSAEAIAARVDQLRESAGQLAALDPASLTDRQRFDRELLIAGVDGELFELTEWRAFRRNPMALMGPIEVTSYMDRSYAPPEERAAPAGPSPTAGARLPRSAGCTARTPVPRAGPAPEHRFLPRHGGVLSR